MKKRSKIMIAGASALIAMMLVASSGTSVDEDFENSDVLGSVRIQQANELDNPSINMNYPNQGDNIGFDFAETQSLQPPQPCHNSKSTSTVGFNSMCSVSLECKENYIYIPPPDLPDVSLEDLLDLLK